mgnify:FL=1
MSHAALAHKSFVFKHPTIGSVVADSASFTLHSGHRNRRYRFHDSLISAINSTLEVLLYPTLSAKVVSSPLVATRMRVFGKNITSCVPCGCLPRGALENVSHFHVAKRFRLRVASRDEAICVPLLVAVRIMLHLRENKDKLAFYLEINFPHGCMNRIIVQNRLKPINELLELFGFRSDKHCSLPVPFDNPGYSSVYFRFGGITV